MDLVQIFLYFSLQIDLIGNKATKTLAVWWEKYECEYYDLDCVEDEVMVMHRIWIWIFHKTVVLLVLWLSVTEERCPSKSLSASAVNANRWWNSWRHFLIKNYNVSPRSGVSIIFKIRVIYKAWFEGFEFFIVWPYAVFHKMQVVFYKSAHFMYLWSINSVFAKCDLQSSKILK